MIGYRRWLLLGVAFGVSLGGCEADKPKPDTEKKEAAEEPGAEKKPVLDNKIANAMQAAARAEAAPEQGAEQGAPPPDGILGAEGADRELARGKPADIVLGSTGGTPKLNLSIGELKAGEGPRGNLQVKYRVGGSVMPTIDFGFSSLRTELSEPDPLKTRFQLLKAAPAADQPGRLPPNAAAELGKLSGSWAEFSSTRSGLLSGSQIEVHGNNPDLGPVVQSAASALTILVLPRPEQAVGPGAFWMVKTRESFSGADTVAYRMVKLEAVQGDVAELSVSTRRYLAAPKLELVGLPPHSVREFKGEGNASLSLRQGAVYPHQARVKDMMGALIVTDDQRGQGAPIQADLTASVQLAAAK